MSLVLRYEFNDPATFTTDSSGNSHTLVDVNNVESVEDATYGTVASFSDNPTKYFSLASAPASTTGSSPHTFSYWIHQVGTDTYRIIHGQGTGGTEYRVQFTQDELDINMGTRTNGGGVPTLQWAHVSITYDGSSERIYVNGSLAKTTAKVLNVATGPLYIGSATTFPTGYSFDGYMLDFRIYDDALSDTDVSTLYTEGPNPATDVSNTTPNPILSYAFNDSDLGVDTISGFDLTNTNVTLVTDPERGPVASFDGSTSNLVSASDVPDSITGSGHRTFMVWLKKNQSSEDNIFFYDYGSPGTGLAWRGQIKNNEYLINMWSMFTTSTAIQDDTWIHVASTHDGENTRTYINGVESGDTYAFHSTTDTGVSPLWIGCRVFYNGGITGGAFFEGLMSDFRVYDSALSESEISTAMSSGFPSANPPRYQSAPPVTGAVSYLRVNDLGSLQDGDTVSSWGAASTTGSPVYKNDSTFPYVQLNGGYFTLGNETIQPSLGFTFVGYVLTTSVGAEYPLIYSYAEGQNDGLRIYRTGGSGQHLVFRSQKAASIEARAEDATTTNTWQVITSRVTDNGDSTLTMEIFLDNVLQGSTTEASSDMSGIVSGLLEVGQSTAWGGNPVSPIYVSDMYFYDRALSDTELGDMHTYLQNLGDPFVEETPPDTTTFVEDGVVMYVDASNEASYTPGSKVMNDLSGSSVVFDMEPGVSTSLNDGGLDFSAGTNYLKLSQALQVQTISLWYKKGISPAGKFIELRDTNGGGEFVANINQNTIEGDFFLNGSIYVNGVLTSGADYIGLDDDTWYHVVFVGSYLTEPTRLTLFANLNLKYPYKLIFGSALFYDRVLTEAEIAHNYSVYVPAKRYNKFTVSTVETNTELHITEFELYDQHGENIALLGTASQNTSWQGTTASIAINGYNDGTVASGDTYSFTHTLHGGTWTLDLHQSYLLSELSHIVFYQRNTTTATELDRFIGAKITAHSEDGSEEKEIGVGTADQVQTFSISTNPGNPGSDGGVLFNKVTLSSVATGQLLNFTEFELYDQSGTNIALLGTASQSSQWYTAIASTAINGGTDETVVSGYDYNFSATAHDGGGGTWVLELDRGYLLSELNNAVFYNRFTTGSEKNRAIGMIITLHSEDGSEEQEIGVGTADQVQTFPITNPVEDDVVLDDDPTTGIVESGLVLNVNTSNDQCWDNTGKTLYNLVEGSTSNLELTGSDYTTEDNQVNVVYTGAGNTATLETTAAVQVQTVMFWIKRNASNHDEYLIDGRNDIGNSYIILNGPLGPFWSGEFYVNGVLLSNNYLLHTIPLDEWTSVVITGSSSTTGSIRLLNGNGRNMDASLRIVLVYDRVLTQEEVTQNHNQFLAYDFESGPIVLPDPLMVYKMNTEDLGNDSSVSSLHLANTGVTLVTDSERGRVASFNGNSTLVLSESEVPTALLGSNPRTLLFWIKHDGTNGSSGNQTMVYNGGATYYERFLFLLAYNNVSRIDTAGQATDGTIQIEKNVWAHMAITHQGGQIRLYVNGVESLLWDRVINTDSGEFSVGDNRENHSKPYSGLMSDLRIYGQALSVEQIQAICGGNDVSADFILSPSVVSIGVTITEIEDAISYRLTRQSEETEESISGDLGDPSDILIHPVTISDLAPETTYTIRLYVDLGSGYELVVEEDCTTLVDSADNYDLGQLQRNGVVDMVGLTTETRRLIEKNANEIFATGNKINIPAVEAGEDLTIQASFVNLDGNIGVTEPGGAILVPFGPEGGTDQKFTLNTGNDDSLEVGYNEVTNAVEIGGIEYPPGSFFIFGGSRFVVQELVL